MPREMLEIMPPVAGLNRAARYQSQPPYSTQLCKNVRGIDVIERRGRNSSRGGMVKAFQQQLGNVVLDGRFATGTPWTAGVGWSIAGGVATAAGGINTDLSQTAGPLVDGGTYRVTFTMTVSAGGVTVVCGTATGTHRTSAGTYTEDIICAGSTGFKFTGGGFTGTIQNVSAVRLDVPAGIQLGSAIRSLAATTARSYTDEFTGTSMTADWSAPSWTINGILSAGAPIISSADFIGSFSKARNERILLTASPDYELRAAVLDDQGITMTADRRVVVGIGNGNMFGRIHLCMDMALSSPDPDSGIRLEWDSTGASNEHLMNLWVDGVLRGQFPLIQFINSPYLLTLQIDSSNIVRVYAETVSMFGGAPVSSAQLFTYPLTNYIPAGPRVGFALETSTDGFGPIYQNAAFIDNFTLLYTSSVASAPPESMIFASGGILYREAPQGTLIVPSDVDASSFVGGLATDRRLYSASRLQELYIADYALRIQGTAGTINAAGTTFDDAAVSDWTAHSITPGTDVLEIISGTGTLNTGMYTISAVASGSLTISPSAGVSATAITYRIVRWPKVYNGSNNTLSRVGMGTIGVSQFPAGCRSVTLWADRLFWCNDPYTIHGWWLSASGYPTDYDYGDTGGLGSAAAVAGTQSELAGLIGEPLVTGIAINDDLLIIACRTSFYFLRGNPRAGGQLNNITRQIGILDIGAWCQTPGGRLIVMTPDGLYEITIDRAIPLSRHIIPRELIGINVNHYEVSMGYDLAAQGIRISCTGRTAGTASIHYFYDEARELFWPDVFESDYDPSLMAAYQPGGVELPVLLFAGRDGYVRRFEDSAFNDDDIPFDTLLMIGPMRAGRTDDIEGTLHELWGTLDLESGDVVVGVHVGSTVQEALNSEPVFEVTWTAGKNPTEYIGAACVFFFISLTGAPCSRWVFESAGCIRESRGRLRNG